VTSGLVVTGAGGWFGRTFITSLADQGVAVPVDTVRAFVQAQADADFVRSTLPQAQVVVGDVRSDADVAELYAGLDTTYLVHAAGIIHPDRITDFIAVNADGTRRVVTAALAAGAQRIVHISSNSPMGTNPSPDEVFRDDEPFNPYYGYGVSKMRAESIVRQLLETADVPGVIVRPPWFYGPHQPDRQARFLRSVRLGRFPFVGKGTNRRSMVFTEHLAQGVRLALTSQHRGLSTYWIADPQPYSMLEVIHAVREAARAEGLEVMDRNLYLPDIVGRMAEQADSFLQSRGRYQQEIHVLGELNKNISCSIAGARRDLGYDPRTSLVDGMRRSYRYGLDNGQAV
jgi:nucleoside-diphosphate-sugar epimerase